MPDLLAHALLAYTLARVLAWRYAWITRPYVTAAMAGAFIPDLAKADLLVRSWRIEQLLGLPFDWSALHTGGPVLLVVGLGALIVVPAERPRAVTLLALGAASHLLADALLQSPTGQSYAILWPITRYHPPTPGVYLSTQPTPTIAALAAALTVTIATRYARTPRTS